MAVGGGEETALHGAGVVEEAVDADVVCLEALDKGFDGCRRTDIEVAVAVERLLAGGGDDGVPLFAKHFYCGLSYGARSPCDDDDHD